MSHLLSQEDDQRKWIDCEDEPKQEPMAGGECRKQIKKPRSAQVHNLSERLRRRRLKEKMKCLQELVPSCSRRDKASILDDTIKYIKILQYQLQMMSMAQGFTVPHAAYMIQSPMHGVQLPSLPQFPQSSDYGLGDGIGISDLATSQASAATGPPILGAMPELVSMPTGSPAAFPILGGISEDVTIFPRHDLLESLSSSNLVPFLGTSFPLAEVTAMRVHPSSPVSCHNEEVSYIVPLEDRGDQPIARRILGASSPIMQE